MEEKKNQKKVFNFDDSPLVRTTEQTVVEGYQKIEREAMEQPDPTATPTATAQQQEPTKGIQTDVPMSLYVRLVNMKLRRGEPICAMMIKALESWLTQQERL